jgi:hypothetical protein
MARTLYKIQCIIVPIQNTEPIGYAGDITMCMAENRGEGATFTFSSDVMLVAD